MQGPKRSEVVLTISKAKDKITAVLSMSSKQRKVRRGSAAILFLFLITLVMSFDFVNEKANLTVGQVSPKTYKAEKSTVFEDQYQTDIQRRFAAERVGKIYTKDPQVSIAVQEDISLLAQKLLEVQTDTSVDVAEKGNRLRSYIPFAMFEADLNNLAQGDVKDTGLVETEINKLISSAMEVGDGITPDKLEESKKNIKDQVTGMRLSKPYENFAMGAVDYYIRPNCFVDNEKTRQQKEEAMAAVPTVIVSVKEGEKIIGE
ncbi:MAG: phosphohydrolase, partial [Desulfotomaculaceae bacterium]|nr:phosphohydrolase [Desulfotomaculaceae bacterium]